MAELVGAGASLSTLLLALLVFGFAPGLVLRLLVLACVPAAPGQRGQQHRGRSHRGTR